MSETKRFDPYTGDPIPDEAVEQAEPTAMPAQQTVPDGQAAPADNTAGGFNVTSDSTENGTAYQQTPSQGTTAYSTPPQSETQYNPYTGQAINNTNSEEAAEKDHKANIYGTVALIAGICSIVFSFCSLCCCPFLTIVAGVLGIIFGCLAKNSMDTRVGTGTAGLITSIIGLVLCLLITLFMIISSGDDFMDSFERGFRNGMNGYNFYNNNDYDHHDFDYDNLYENDDFYVR
ncbi:MAG: DUF4190 domain-containing protein [Ruminococcus flavefaciens]|nr:DUF4190 domain-containing protein [Ruminococcus flavefaciens]